jgi:hypothetical protein
MLKKIFVIFLTVAILLFNVEISNASTIDKQLETLKADVSNANKQYNVETEKLKKISAQYPSFTIQGELNSVVSGSVYVWGIAIGDGTTQNPGWQLKEGNLKITNADSKKINYIANIYADSNHYYVKTESGVNAFGVKVPIKVYTKTVPSALKSQKDKNTAALKTLQSKGIALEKYIDVKYKKLLASTSNVITLKTYTKELQQLHDFLKQNTNNKNIYKLTESFYLKLLKSDPKDIESMYLVAKFYKDNNNLSESNKIYTNIASSFPEEFIKRADLKADIWFITETLSKVGYPNYSVKALETYISKEKLLPGNTAVSEHYAQYLYEAAVKETNNSIKKEYLEKAKNTISKYELTTYSGIMQKDLYESTCKMLGDIYLSEGDTENASKIFDEVGTGNFNKDKNAYENDKNVLKLADDFAKKGDYKNSYKYFDELITQYNRYNDVNQNKDMELVSENEYSNLLLGLAYLSHTRPKGEEVDYGLKYLNIAYKINTTNAMTNNALGYLYQHYYMDYPQKFNVTDSEKMSEKDVILKIIGYYNEAIKKDPGYKRAYGNLYSIYAQDYKSGVQAALKELHGIDVNDIQKYYTTMKSLKDAYYDKSQNPSGFSENGTELVEDFK